ncbi:hypothetical protein Tco_1004769 [Tanacetum coccineum]|uniref:Uncharacterized protein n=1 Tax=Tanacetum coccineum TaxID=301880 RepID=A0ABQ5FCT6_9ASTR
MTIPRPPTTPRAGVLIPFVIISDSDDEVIALPVRPAPPSLDYVSGSPDYTPYSDLNTNFSEDESLDEDPTKTAESLLTQCDNRQFSDL